MTETMPWSTLLQSFALALWPMWFALAALGAIAVANWWATR